MACTFHVRTSTYNKHCYYTNVYEWMCVHPTKCCTKLQGVLCMNRIKNMRTAHDTFHSWRFPLVCLLCDDGVRMTGNVICGYLENAGHSMVLTNCYHLRCKQFHTNGWSKCKLTLNTDFHALRQLLVTCGKVPCACPIPRSKGSSSPSSSLCWNWLTGNCAYAQESVCQCKMKLCQTDWQSTIHYAFCIFKVRPEFTCIIPVRRISRPRPAHGVLRFVQRSPGELNHLCHVLM